MAKRFTDLNELTTPASDDQLAIVDTSANETKRISLLNMLSNFVDAVHLKANSVITSKILDDAVTDAKLVYGKVHKRQGGHATNFNAAGTTNYDVTGNVKVQMGIATSTAGEFTVTFPEAFTNIPHVMISQASANGYNGYCRYKTSQVTTTQIGGMLFLDSGGNVRAGELIAWVAIGQGA